MYFLRQAAWLAAVFFMGAAVNASAQETLTVKSNYTRTYAETVSEYLNLAENDARCRLFEYGRSDAGPPVHLFVISQNEEFRPGQLREQGKTVLLVNNAIHPGEPCGVDASIAFAKKLLDRQSEESRALEKMVVCIVPVYNIGGALNRGRQSRANQNGPLAYGFRGNARNLDLNRDFAKANSANTLAFYRLFAEWKPDVFIDTHTTDGADYSYAMTLISPIAQTLAPPLGAFAENEMVPALYSRMARKNNEMCPYVFTVGESPKSGLRDFLETPRYSTGFTELFNTISFVSEAHMLKPYHERVGHTYHLLLETAGYMSENASKIRRLRAEADAEIRSRKQFTLKWELDESKSETIRFKGYREDTVVSALTGERMIRYNSYRPRRYDIPYFKTYKPVLTVEKPQFYLIPQAYPEIADRLRAAGVRVETLREDLEVTVEVYYIERYETSEEPYEGVYLHTDVEVRKDRQRLAFRTGDYFVETNQQSNRMIVELLEPQSPDSYFAWGFFDGCLMQKEWYSTYIFEQYADTFLKARPTLKAAFERKKRKDPAFAKDPRAQLYYLYKLTPLYEPTHRRYPIARYSGKAIRGGLPGKGR